MKTLNIAGQKFGRDRVGVTTIRNAKSLFDAQESRHRLHKSLVTITQFTVDKSWAPCDVCCEDTRCRVLRASNSKENYPKPLTRHIRCHKQLEAGMRQDRGAVLPVIGKDYIFRVPNRHERNRSETYTEEQKEHHQRKWRRKCSNQFGYPLMVKFNQPYDPIMYLNNFDGVKVIQVHLDGVKTRDVQ